MKQKYGILILTLLVQALAWAAGPWQMKPPMEGEGRHRGLAISIGNKGYVGTGHYNGTGQNVMFDDWWEFDPSTNSWSQKADYPYLCQGSVGWGTATKGYVGGGSVSGNQYFSYDPITNAWTAIAPCPVATGDKESFMVNGKGYVLGTGSLYEYDPSTNAWTQKANPPFTPTTWLCAFETATSGFVKNLFNLYEYKPLTNTWITRANFPGIMVSGGTAFQVHNKGYVVGGYYAGLGDVTGEIWEFNPGSNTWTQMADFPGTSRRFLSSFAIGNKGFVAIGTNGINFNDLWQFSYDPLSVDELYLNEKNIKAFPNPVVNQFTLQIESEFMETVRNAEVKVRSVDGRMVASEIIQDASTKILRDEEPTGIYFYSIVKNNRTLFTGKIIYQ